MFAFKQPSSDVGSSDTVVPDHVDLLVYLGVSFMSAGALCAVSCLYWSKCFYCKTSVRVFLIFVSCLLLLPSLLLLFLLLLLLLLVKAGS